MAKTISPAVPAVAPLTGIEDDAARQALQALADAHTTRNSAGDEGFVTRGELTQAVPQMIVEGLSATGGSVAGAGSGANWWGAVQAEIDRAVFASLAYQQINKKIEWMDATNNLSLKKIAELGDGFTTERIERREGDTALLTEVKALKVTTANNTAAILEEQTVRTTADSALAQDLLTLTSQVNTNSATIQTNQETQATWNTAAASQLTTLQAGVAGNAAAIQAESTARATLEGDLQATWTVRANVNGHVAGVALGVKGGGGTATSAFVVQASKFAVVTPGSVPQVPFYISDGVIYFNGAVQFSNVQGAGTLAGKDNLLYDEIGGTKPPANATRNVYRGDWASSTAYEVGDIVISNGNGWICTTTHTSSSSIKPPTTSTGTSSYWGLYTVQGDTGPQGIQGIAGPSGADGVTYYTWVKYADTPTSGMSDYPSGKKYLGIAYNKTTATESTSYSDYSWSLIQGDQGIQGPTGADGQTTYTWIKYADSSTGSGLSDSPAGKTYIGIAVNKTTPIESTTASHYTWALIQGPQGVQGIPGADGATGASSLRVFKAGTSVTTPTSSTGVPSGWSTTPPGGTNPIWESTGTRDAGGTWYTWTTPVVSAEFWRKPNTTTIDGNKIYTGDAYVDTLQIKGNAVTVPVVDRRFDTISGAGMSTLRRVAQATITLDAAGWVYALFTANQTYASGLRDSIAVLNLGGQTVGVGGQAVTTNIAVSDAAYLNAGTHTVYVDWLGQDSTVKVTNRVLFVMGAMR